MADVLKINRSTITSLFNKIRAKAGVTGSMSFAQAESVVENISTGTDTSDATLEFSEYLVSPYTAYGKSGKLLGTLSLDSELTEQDTLLSQITTALEGKAGGSGGSAPKLEEKTITANGVYIPTKDGFSKVTVDVPIPETKNIQAFHGMASTSATSYTATSVSLTVEKTGTYQVSWMGFRNTNSGTSGSQLYIGNTAYGTANTSFVNTYGHSVVLDNVSLTAGQTITVRARARSTSYIMAVGNLVIEEI